MSSTYLLSWDMYGLEACINVSEIEHDRIINILSNKSAPDRNNITLNSIILRAKFNPQRHYEIYMIEVSDGITEEDLKNLFKDSPQYAAELIRERGHKIYSDRMNIEERNRILIT